MIYHMALYALHFLPFLNVVHYISFRAIAALLTAVTLSLVYGERFILFSQKFFRSQVRAFTPATHESKNDMPTMGGLFMVGVVLVTMSIWGNWYAPLTGLSLACLVGFAGIGFLDDYYKIIHKKGISAGIKFMLQVLVAAVTAGAWIVIMQPSTELVFPFFKNIHPELGWLFLPWALFVLIGTSNAVNLTDGLDGLAIGSLISNFGVFALIAYSAGHIKIAHYLCIPYAGTAELAVVASALVGASLGFLWFNTYPAQIFMGDVGSLGLGAVLGFIALASKQELLLVIAGGLFVVETLSVIAQVVAYRFFGKRLFRMAPIHHHFELLGWPESKITIRFCIISFILCLCALITLKLR